MFELEQIRFKSILNLPYLKLDRPVTCIVGPSGSGKTTLLKHLNRLYSPDSGVIRYQGEELARMDPVALRRRVVMLGQTPVLHGSTIEENLQSGLAFSQKLPASRRDMARALEQVGLEKQLDAPCHKLSGGEKQRLCLARVLLMDAEAILLDEPSAALDKETERFVIQNLAVYAQKAGKQLVMVTHSEEVSALYPEGILTLRNGTAGGYDNAE